MQKINDVTIQRVEPAFALFVFLTSLREELCSRNDTVTRAKRLPRYVERDPRNGSLSFRVDRGARVPLPRDPTSRAFRAAYSAALVDAIAMENDDDE